VPQIPAEYRSQFDETPGYLDFARFGPPSRAVLDATARLLAQAARADRSTVDDLMRQEPRARAAVARLTGSDLDQVVLLPNTSLGLFQAAFNAAPRDSAVLVSGAEFPANTYPWARAGSVGLARVRWLPPGPVTPDVLRAELSEDIGAVSVSAVDFRTGHRADLAAIREVIGDRLLIVDGIQGFGVIDEPWSVADIVVAGGQKWLRAGWGTGFATLSDRALERTPVLSGWTGVDEPGLLDDTVHPPTERAASWSVTNLSPVSAGAFAAALELVETAGVPAIERALAERVERLREVLRSAGARILSRTEPGRGAGIVTFTVPDHPVEAVGAALAAAGIAATVRTGHVRVSPHVSTSDDTIDRLRPALRRLRTATPMIDSAASGPSPTARTGVS
jgi:selenocysteine lyase/cysteine desulfurase